MSNLIIVPVHPPHFHWAKQLLDSAHPSEQIALGFSNQNDANSFSHPFPFKTLVANIPSNERGIVSKKKFNLLKQIYWESKYYDYEYVATIDAECKFLQPVTNSLEQLWHDNCFVANHSIDGARIMKDLAKLCGYEHIDDLYPWFNSVPVFKTELLPDFFNWLDTKTEALNLGFDFLLFALYCRYVLNMPWRILEGSAWHGLVENGDEWKKPQHKHLISQVSWSTYHKGIEQYPNIKMLFHLDRYPIR